MSRKCEDFQNMIKDELAGELSLENQSELAVHLADCSICLHERQELQRTFGMLKSLEEQPVPGHFFVYEQPKASLLERFRGIPKGFRWAAATGFACLLLLAGFIISNISIRVGESRIILAYGDPITEPDVQDIRREFEQKLLDARREDQRVFAGLLEEQRKLYNGSLNQYYQRVDTRVNNLEGQLVETINDNNAALQARLEGTMIQYGELMKAQYQNDLRDINRRLTQITLEGRLRDNQTDALMNTLVQLADSDYRPTGGIDD